MMPRILDRFDLSSSASVLSDKREKLPDSHVRWENIKKFIYIASSLPTFNFDLFSRLSDNIRVFEYIICQVTIGMPYMLMDCFIKQYTGRLDCNRRLNPLLRGITIGLLLQTGLWTLLHAGYLADILRFLSGSFRQTSPWSVCLKTSNATCVSAKDVILRCNQRNLTNFAVTSAHYHYLKSFTYLDKTVLTTRFFSIALVWIFCFLFSTVNTTSLLKIFKIAILSRTISSFVTITFIIINKKYDALRAFHQIMDVTTPHSFIASMEHMSYTFGIGLLGFYSFGILSPYTMVDNAVVSFTMISTFFSLIRSFIVRTLYQIMANCVHIEVITPHYLLFAILPMGTEFLYAHKLYVFYIYLNLMAATMVYIIMLTLTMSKFLHTEFHSVKVVYIIGLLCFIGFSASVPISIASMMTSSRIKGLLYGINTTVLYLGGFKTAIVMWVYGVQRFRNDMHFWLGFKPTKFWTLCWMLQPIILLFFVIHRVYLLTRMTDVTVLVTATIWILLTALVVIIFHTKTIAKYIMLNELSAAFRNSFKYGPADPDDRNRRRSFHETYRHKQCRHNCIILDDTFECNHLLSTSTGAIASVSASTSSCSSSDKSVMRPLETGTLKRAITRMNSVETEP